MPAQINNRALNRAWVIRWKSANLGCCSPRAAIITPNCLRVERAMIFFRSHSRTALRPAISIVRVLVNKRAGANHGNEERNG